MMSNAAPILEVRGSDAQLVEVDRLALLQALITGITHEINTPVGITLTAASHLAEQTDSLQRWSEGGGLRRKDFDEYVRTAGEAARLILANAERAAALIHGFKQVAVDQASAQRRAFAVKRYIGDILVSMGPRLRQGGHHVHLTCPEDLWIDGYPGALSHILINLLTHSLERGFRPGQKGTIAIAVSGLKDGWVQIIYRDDGDGIPSTERPFVFVPCSAARSDGGVPGRGLHVVEQIVTKHLHGRISLESQVGVGTQFVVLFPAVAPRQE